MTARGVPAPAPGAGGPTGRSCPCCGNPTVVVGVAVEEPVMDLNDCYWRHHRATAAVVKTGGPQPLDYCPGCGAYARVRMVILPRLADSVAVDRIDMEAL